MQAVDAELKGFLNQRNLFWKQSSWAKHLLSDSISVFVCNRRPIPQRYNKWVFRCPNNVPKYQDLQYLATNYADVSDYSSKTNKMKVYNYSDQSQTRKKIIFLCNYVQNITTTNTMYFQTFWNWNSKVCPIKISFFKPKI